MGAPKRNRRKYAKPKGIWNLQRIGADNSLKDEYALKNMKELWKVQSRLSDIRSNVRQLLSGNASNPIMEKNILSSLSRLGVVGENPKLDDLLELKENVFLERRLQSLVYRKGLARTMKQSRQLIVHGFIAIGGKKVDRPGYMVSSSEEKLISYYKPIDVNVNSKAQGKTEEKPEPATAQAEAKAAEKPAENN